MGRRCAGIGRGAAALAAALASCGLVSCSRSTRPTRSVVVTTSMLECIARELLAGTSGVEVVSLLPPGSCPGHFDLAPGALPAFRAAVLVLRHDFQGALDEKMRALGARGVAVVPVSSHGSLLVPANFRRLAGEVAAELSRSLPALGPAVARNLGALDARATSLEREVLGARLPWRGAPAVASLHQKELAEWLGLRVTGVLGRPEDVSPGELERLVSGDAVIVVGNLQEGPQAALALGARKGVPVAVFSNFPGVEGYGSTYEDLVRANVRRLEAAWASR